MDHRFQCPEHGLLGENGESGDVEVPINAKVPSELDEIRVKSVEQTKGCK